MIRLFLRLTQSISALASGSYRLAAEKEVSQVARTRDQAARRAQILDAATRSALHRGLFQLRIKDVAKSVGVTEGAVLYYYGSLDELRLQVFARASERWYESRTQVATEGSASEQLLTLARAGLTAQIPEVRLLNEPIAGVSIVPAFRAVAESLFVREVARYQVILERGAASGEFALRATSLDAARNLVSLEESYRLHVLARTAITTPIALGLVLSYAELVTGAVLTERVDAAG